MKMRKDIGYTSPGRKKARVKAIVGSNVNLSRTVTTWPWLCLCWLEHWFGLTVALKAPRLWRRAVMFGRFGQALAHCVTRALRHW